MAFARSESGCEADEPNHDDDDRIRVAEIEETSAHFRQKKEYADGYNDHGSHEAANGAALAGAMNSIAHLCPNSRRSLLFTAIHPVAEHQNAHTDQDGREEKLRDAVPGEPIKVVEQEQQAGANQKDWTDGSLLGETI
jgi:hypothetical protein